MIFIFFVVVLIMIRGLGMWKAKKKKPTAFPFHINNEPLDLRHFVFIFVLT